MLICWYKFFTHINTTLHSTFCNRYGSKYIPHIFTLCIHMFVHVHIRNGVHIVSSFSLSKGHVLYIWNYNNDVDILNTDNV